MESEGRKDRIRIAEEGLEKSHRPTPTRRGSNASSMSIHSVRGKVVSAPENLLPITYRTLSYKVENSSEDSSGDSSTKQERKHLKGITDLDWHRLSIDELQQRLSTSLKQGLSAEQVNRRTSEYGKNKPSPPPSRWFRTLMSYLFGGFGSILLFGCVMVFISWRPLGNPPSEANLALAIVLLAVFIIQALFNAWQDWSSSRVMASITTMLPDECIVIRDGKQVSITAVDLVPGDVIQIKQGNKLPADVRFAQISADAKFDRSILTGESEPVTGTVHSTDDNYLETHCIGLQSTHCVSGTALAICVGTGDLTVFGRIAGLSNRRRTEMTPMQKEVRRFVLIIASFIITVVIILVVVWAAWLRKDHPAWINVPTLIVSCVSVGIAFIPEGLPVSLTMSLTIVANIMKRNKILCKTLATVETLGAVSVICSDKTGTLTKNEMFVTDCFSGGEEYPAQAAKERMVHGDGPNTLPNESIGLLRNISGLCNAAEFDASTLDRPLHLTKIYGDPTDQAILRLAQSLSPVSELRDQWKKLFEISFNSKNKFMIRVMSPAQTQSESGYLFIKGAPDILLPRCTSAVQRDGTIGELSDGDRDKIETIKNDWSGRGKRVILMAQKQVTDEWTSSLSKLQDERIALGAAEQGLTFVGIVGLVDPPRDEIPSVIDTLRKASIRIMMVTGDYKLTAQAIAIECGIIRTPAALIDDIKALEYTEKTTVKAPGATNAIVVSGPELADLSEEQWEKLCGYDEVVFARTTPDQKLRIVREFQSRDNIVAMTGDGVNDAPSLKAADIGVALGSGSDIAIEAADMVLLESFSAIVEAVKYGRLVFDNLKKTIIYLLPAGSFSELWPVFTNVILGVPQILSSFLMIIICCLTDCAGAITLAFEKAESDVLLRPPRDTHKDRLVDVKFLAHAYGFVGLYMTFMSYVMAFWHMQRRGVPFSAVILKYGNYDSKYDPDFVTQVGNEASSIYFVNLVIMQFFNLLAVRTRRLSIFQQPPLFNKKTQNLLLFPAMVFALCMVFIFCYPPGLQKTIATTTIPVEHFFLPVAFGIGLLMLDETRKYCVRRWPKGLLARVAWAQVIERNSLRRESSITVEPCSRRHSDPCASTTLSGTLYAPAKTSIARREPSAENDASWLQYESDLTHAITREGVVKLGKDPDRVAKFDDAYWGLGNDSYMVQLDVTHQIHCLNMLRRAAFFNYPGYTPDINMNEPIWWIHLGHCTDMLLQNIKCNANPEVYTLAWLEDFDKHWPDFSINRQCRDFDALIKWQHDNAVDTEKLHHMPIPPDAFRWPAPWKSLTELGHQLSPHYHKNQAMPKPPHAHHGGATV